jgi:uncharacterized protein (DUF1697 family)
VPTHIALLRGINVGGGGKMPMAELRRLVTSMGHADVATYIQTGNVIFSAAHDDARLLSEELEAAILEAFGIRAPVIVLTRAELAEKVSSNPYQDEPNPRSVHVVFLRTEPDKAARERVREAVAAAADQGTADEASIVGGTLYVHTPDGFGTSELAKELLMSRRNNPFATATARNWATTTKLLAMMGDAP